MHHDRVISELYAIGLAVQSLLKKASDPDQQGRLGDIIDWLGAAIADLRAATFDLVQDGRRAASPLEPPGGRWSGTVPGTPPRGTGTPSTR